MKIVLNWLIPFFGAGFLSLFLAPALAQDFRITAISLDAENRPRLEFESDTNFYYVLYRGQTVTNITTPVVMKLGVEANGAIVDGEPFNGQSVTRFFRVRKVPLASPVDTDGDGIDDLYELAHPSILNPLNAADGEQDPDADDLTNAEEYVFGTDPSSADSDGDGWIDSIERGDGTNPLNPASRPQNTLLAGPSMLVDVLSADVSGASGQGVVLAMPPVLIDLPSPDGSGAAGSAVFLARPPVALEAPSGDAAGLTGAGVLLLANPLVLIELPSADGAGAAGAPLFLSRPPMNLRLNSQ